MKAIGHRRGLMAALARLAADLHKQNPNRISSSSTPSAPSAPSPVVSQSKVVGNAVAAALEKVTSPAPLPPSQQQTVVSARSAMDLFAAPSPAAAPIVPSTSSSSSSLFDIPAPASSASPIVDRKVKSFCVYCLSELFSALLFISTNSKRKLRSSNKHSR